MIWYICSLKPRFLNHSVISRFYLELYQVHKMVNFKIDGVRMFCHRRVTSTRSLNYHKNFEKGKRLTMSRLLDYHGKIVQQRGKYVVSSGFYWHGLVQFPFLKLFIHIFFCKTLSNEISISSNLIILCMLTRLLFKVGIWLLCRYYFKVWRE